MRRTSDGEVERKFPVRKALDNVMIVPLVDDITWSFSSFFSSRGMALCCLRIDSTRLQALTDNSLPYTKFFQTFKKNGDFSL